MKNYLLIVIISVLALASCQSKSEHEEEGRSSFNTSEVQMKRPEDVKSDSASKKQSFIVERLVPANAAPIEFDTLLSEQKIQIFLKRSYLESYVLDQYEINDTIYHDKYLDAMIHLNIKKRGRILVDTVFNKASFLKFTDKEFLEIAQFHNYWFRELSSSRLEFFGVISKPETDWSFAFSHYFNTDGMTFLVEPYEEEDI